MKTLLNCDGKLRYATWAAAEKGARGLRRGGTPIGVYQCRSCGQFHIGGRRLKRQIVETHEEEE